MPSLKLQMNTFAFVVKILDAYRVYSLYYKQGVYHEYNNTN